MKAIFYDLSVCPTAHIRHRNSLTAWISKCRQKCYERSLFLQENGSDLRELYSEYLRDGILELRAKVGFNISRVLYFFYDGKKAVLTHGFIKKTQKTPKKEIHYKEEYFSRKERKTK